MRKNALKWPVYHPYQLNRFSDDLETYARTLVFLCAYTWAISFKSDFGKVVKKGGQTDVRTSTRFCKRGNTNRNTKKFWTNRRLQNNKFQTNQITKSHNLHNFSTKQANPSSTRGPSSAKWRLLLVSGACAWYECSAWGAFFKNAPHSEPSCSSHGSLSRTQVHFLEH